MSTTTADVPMTARWHTYGRALLFVLPAVLAWWFACLFLVPKVDYLCRAAHVEGTPASWLWTYAQAASTRSLTILLVAVALLVLLEFIGHGWARYRPVVVSSLVWLTNVGVLLSLISLVVLLCVAVPVMLHAKGG